MKKDILSGCGLGLREDFIFDVPKASYKPDFFEIAPENWMEIPGKYLKVFENIVSEHQIICHGLSLSIGSYEGVNVNFLKKIKNFLDRYEIKVYSEHLSFSSLQNIQSYELLPLPMDQRMVQNICNKIDFVQNYLKRELILENATYYYVPDSTMEEIDFINEIFKKSGAKMLLDINNIFVNSHNHKFNPYKYIDNIDLNEVFYCHVAGHLEYEENLWVDTHGMDVKDEVWDLTKYVLNKKKLPVLLERDNNIPPFEELMQEYQILKSIYEKS